jgi:hypothetical protein
MVGILAIVDGTNFDSRLQRKEDGSAAVKAANANCEPHAEERLPADQFLGRVLRSPECSQPIQVAITNRAANGCTRVSPNGAAAEGKRWAVLLASLCR